MYCNYCGSRLLDLALFCHNCGKRQLYIIGQAAVPTQGQTASPARSPDKGYKWPTVYGWFLLILGISLVCMGVWRLHERSIENATFSKYRPPGYVDPFPLLPAATVFQGFLWISTSVGVLKRKSFAIELVWVMVILQGVGVVLGGIVPLQLLIWLAFTAAAVWFSKKRRFLSRALE